MFPTGEELQSWRNEMHGYEKGKRTKKPFGKQFKPSNSFVTDSQIKEKDRVFNPVLQIYRQNKREKQATLKEERDRNNSLVKHLMQTGGSRDYDIVNLHGAPMRQEPKAAKIKAPIRNVYNPINNQPIPEFYLAGRDVKLPIKHDFKNLNPKGREFNIVTGQYHEDNDEKVTKEISNQNNKIMSKYKNSHVYDAVYGRYYDPRKQEEYNEQLSKSQMLHGLDFNNRLPPTYINRQPLVLDPTKPSSEALAALDQKKYNSKQRYRLKYLLEEEYARRNIEAEDRKQAQLLNRVHNSHILELKAREFDVVNLNRYDPNRAESLFHKQAVSSTWDRLNRKSQSGIKSSGFS